MSMMALQQELDRLYTTWFRLADSDRDGRVGGGEAVNFFMSRAGLSQSVLGQIWELGASGAAWLDDASFRRVCQLIWYAQCHGNALPPDSKGVVMKIVSGMATLPPPALAGLEVGTSLRSMRPVGVDMPPATAAAPAPGTQAYTGAGRTSQNIGAVPSAQFGSGATGQVPAQQPVTPSSFAAPATGTPQYPAITETLAEKYGALYKAAAKDAEGNVGGGEVLRLAAAVQLDRSVKKQAWDVVAGSKAALAPQELFTFMYLLDLYTVSQDVPRSLPEGTFPPNVHLAFKAAGLPVPISLMPSTVAHVPLQQQNPVENLALQAEEYRDQQWSMSMHAEREEDPLTAIPRVPKKAVFEGSEGREYDAAGRMPDVDADKVAALSDGEQAARLQKELASASTQDKALFEAERTFESATAEAEFFQASLQALLLFKSRSERALLDTQSRAHGAQREAEEARARYEQMYAHAKASSADQEGLQRHITEAMGQKAEWESKLLVLQQELAALANATPELLDQLQYEIGELETAVAAVEADRAAEDAKTAGLRAAKDALTARTDEVREVLKASEGARANAEDALASAKKELDFTKTGEDADALLGALAEAAAVYKSLFMKAIGAGLQPPRASRIVSDERSVWESEGLLAAQDWAAFKDEGWSAVSDLPDLPDATYLLEPLPDPVPDAIVPFVVRDDPFVDLEALREEDDEPGIEERADGADGDAARDAAGAEGELGDGEEAAPEQDDAEAPDVSALTLNDAEEGAVDGAETVEAAEDEAAGRGDAGADVDADDPLGGLATLDSGAAPVPVAAASGANAGAEEGSGAAALADTSPPPAAATGTSPTRPALDADLFSSAGIAGESPSGAAVSGNGLDSGATPPAADVDVSPAEASGGAVPPPASEVQSTDILAAHEGSGPSDNPFYVAPTEDLSTLAPTGGGSAPPEASSTEVFEPPSVATTAPTDHASYVGATPDNPFSGSSPAAGQTGTSTAAFSSGVTGKSNWTGEF